MNYTREDLKRFGDYIRAQTGKAAQVEHANASYLYSAAEFEATAGPGEHRFFSTAVGATGQGFANPLTQRETNLQTAGVLPVEQAFIVNSIGVHLGWTSMKKDEQDKLLLDVIGDDFFEHAVLTGHYGTVQNFIYGPAFMFPSGLGLGGMTNLTGASVLNNGPLGLDRIFNMPVSVVLGGGNAFHYKLTLQGADGWAALQNTAKFDVWLILSGVMCYSGVAG